MSKFASPRLRGRVVGLCLTLGLSAGIGNTAEPVPAVKVVPDLLELPAMVSPRTAGTMQLAVTRAGNRLVSVGEGGAVLLSDDNGASWRQAVRVPVSVALTDVAFTDAKRGWAVGHSGIVLNTDDGGENWTVQVDGVKAAQLVLQEAEVLIQGGAPGGERALRIAKSLQADGPDKPFLCVAFITPDHGFAVGAYGLALESVDGGRNWQSMTARLPNPAGKHLYRIAITPGGLVPDRLVIAGEQGTLMQSTDGGRSFTAVETPYEGTFFTVLGLADGGVLAAGLKGNVWRSDPALEHWQQVPLTQPVTITAALMTASLMTDNKAVVLTDEVGRVLISRDDGRSFAPAGDGNSIGAAATGLVQNPDGSLTVATARGNRRFDIQNQTMLKEGR